MEANLDFNFSVLLSVYAKEVPEYLEKSLNSIWFEQSLKPSQIIIIKDGPLSNQLCNVIDMFSLVAPVTIVENEVCLGLSASLNIGMKESRFDIVARMDSDDISLPDRFLIQIPYFVKSNLDILGGYAYKMIDESNCKHIIKVPVKQDDIYKLIWTCPFIHPTVILRKSSIDKVGGYNPKSGPRQDDYELWFRCVMNKLKVENVEIPLIKYRFSENNIRKNNVKIGYYRLKVGLHGCVELRLPFSAYLGVFYPFFRSLLPYPLNVFFYNLMSKFNPRNLK